MLYNGQILACDFIIVQMGLDFKIHHYAFMLKKILHHSVLGNKNERVSPEKLLEKQYSELVEQGRIEHDAEQWQALKHLQGLLEKFTASRSQSVMPSWSQFISGTPNVCKSLYLFGDVGSGKSMLMNLFYESCPIAAKRRVHFNVFMQEVHLFVHQFQWLEGADPFSVLAENIKSSHVLLCFDEFHVTDIADAMILGRLFGKLFELGVMVVMTSNRHPRDLYRGGLQKEQFLFFISVLQEHAKIIELTAKKDYRLGQESRQGSYYYPLDQDEQEFIRRRYRELAGSNVMRPRVLEVFGRQVCLPKTCGNLALFSFDELCARALGAADYLAIAQNYPYIILTGIPRMTAEKRNEAKRFVLLIDVLYEHKAVLVCSAEVPPQELYREGDGAFEFKRTISRLIEMQSVRYLQENSKIRLD